MAISILQQPKRTLQPAGMPTVWTVAQDNIVLNETNVKFICEVYVGKQYNPIATNFPTATLKASPNAMGTGMFDVSPVIEAFVDVQQEGRNGISTASPNNSSTFKGVDFSDNKPHAIHLIDKFCTSSENLVWYQLKFRIEYTDTSTGLVFIDAIHDKTAFIRLVYNGVLGNTNPLSYDAWNWYWYDMQDVNYTDGSGDYLIRGNQGSALGGKFISNMPVKQQMGENDYGTIAFFNCINYGNAQRTMPQNVNSNIVFITLEFYNAAGATVQLNSYENIPANGGQKKLTTDLDTSANYIYFGHGLGNMKGRGETWPASAVGYKVYASAEEKRAVGRVYDFEIIYDDCRGYEPVRICFQNALGAWDYYTFNKMSKTTVKSKRKNYQQLAGTWNERLWRPKDHLGGMKVFDNVAVESMTLNSDYISEETAAWFEEMFTSSQVYIVNKFNSDNPVMNFPNANYIHKYIEPVVITSSSYTKKTLANDKLIQYSLKISKSKTLNIQRA
jgi:hypothetical protein|tara:strand:+ start:18092 stop:19594 length:1503 start_codon:yes stop_codon:yes gene_type:complete